MSDLVKRLHIAANNCPTKDDAIMREAADRIEELEREVAEKEKECSEWNRLAIYHRKRGGEALTKLAAEKALADRLWNAWQLNGYAPDAVAAYRKARGM